MVGFSGLEIPGVWVCVVGNKDVDTEWIFFYLIGENLKEVCRICANLMTKRLMFDQRGANIFIKINKLI